MLPHEVQQGRCNAAAMALKAPSVWRSFLRMEIPLMGVARGMTVVLAVGASKAIHPTVSLSPSQVLQGHGETLQQLLWGVHETSDQRPSFAFSRLYSSISA